ncbi:hypothetical protein IJH72_01315 [Candidatus Saccharibacteria bacterium]|nr:hypothetical protein [Candidatus Saccharibacteria bacterium]MBR0372566.1 hypothetical protein [Candidatus Saccharibacteria bacterium]
MSSQIKLSSYKGEGKEKIGRVLDLEKKYFDILWELFTSEKFLKDLSSIEKEIQVHYDFLKSVWDLKNKLKIPAERLVRQYIYRDLSHLVEHIYPSAVSSDCAFITKDAVINIDVKTLDVVGNSGDIKNIQFENNQASFENMNLDVDKSIPNSGVKVECLLPNEYSYNGEEPLPVLSYFFTIIYRDDKKSFELNKDDNLGTIYLKCLPNGLTSPLYDYDLVDNFKTYTYLKAEKGFKPFFLTRKSSEVNDKVKDFVNSKSDYVLINGRNRIGVYNASQTHPRYGIKGVSWFPVPRKKKGYYLEAVCKGNTSRISNEKIENRYDSNDMPWKGVKKLKI